MKKQNIIQRLRQAMGNFLQYWCDHSAAHKAMEKVYVRNWTETDPEAEYSGQILINSDGDLFKVTQRYFVNGHLLREETYHATYGWHSNGHLIAIGIIRFLIFDPEQKRLIVEDCPERGSTTTEIYHYI